VNAVARRLSGGDSWVGGGPCLVNAVARRLSGGDSWVVAVHVWSQTRVD
jgi:hypothetical protein